MKLGQNFLVDRNILDVIERLAALSDEDVVLEVGGGPGVLSAAAGGAGRRSSTWSSSTAASRATCAALLEPYRERRSCTWATR